jgi:Holliday junction resolvase
MRQPEATFRRRALEDLKKIQGLWFVRIEQRSLRGTPDLIGCIRGMFFAIEFKSANGKLTKLQEHTLFKISDAGGFAFVAFPDNWDSVLQTLKLVTQIKEIL